MILIAYIFATAPEEILYNQGPIGVAAVALAYFSIKMLNLLLKDRDKAISDRDTMTQDLLVKVLPAISKNTDVLQDRQEIDRQLIEVIKESNRQLENNTKAFDEVSYLLKHGGKDRVGGR